MAEVKPEVTEQAELDGGIVVGHDGSAASSEAVRWAARMAERLGEPLHVVRVWTLTTAPRPKEATTTYVPPLSAFEAATREELERQCSALALPGDVHFHAVRGRPVSALLEAAARADMLVVGTRGAGGFRGLGFGSTADQVTRHAPCPVVVVPVTHHAD
jgi:nucleotide-binding universal stress UspA family protein